jgi:hypothetical protein
MDSPDIEPGKMPDTKRLSYGVARVCGSPLHCSPSVACSMSLSLARLGRHYATSRKVAGSNPDEVIGFFDRPNASSRTMALGSTRPLTEMSTRNLPGGKGTAGA